MYCLTLHSEGNICVGRRVSSAGVRQISAVFMVLMTEVRQLQGAIFKSKVVIPRVYGFCIGQLDVYAVSLIYSVFAFLFS